MRPDVIVLSHRKGGVGKTSVVANLVTGLAGLGVPVAALDLDPQGNLGEFLGLGTGPDMRDLLLSPEPARLLREALQPVPNYPLLRVARSGDSTKNAHEDLAVLGRQLAPALEGVVAAIGRQAHGNEPASLVFIDPPPGLGHLQVAALTVADHLLIPINPNFASETGIPKMAAEIQEIRRGAGTNVQLLGLIPIRYKRRTLEHKASLASLRESFGEDKIYPAVRDTIRLEEAPGRGLPIWDYAPHCDGARDFARVLIRLMRDLEIEANGYGEEEHG